MAEQQKPVYLRPKILSITIILILFTSIGSVAVWYSMTKTSLTKDLNSAEFVINDLDIVAFTETNVTFMVNISTGLNLEGQSDRVKSITISLSLGEERLFDLDIPPGKEPNSASFFTVPLTTLSSTGSFVDSLLDNVLNGEEVVFDIDGRIELELIGGIADTLTFNNQLYFRSQRRVSLTLEEIILPHVNDSLTSVEVTILNPYSVPLGLGGTGNLFIGDREVGEVALDDVLEVLPGNRSYALQMSLNSPLNDTIGFLLSSSDLSISIDSHLTMYLGDYGISLERTVPVESSDEAVQYTIEEVKQFERDDSDRIHLTFDLRMTNPLPADFNISAVRLQVYTVRTETFLGDMEWNSSEPLFLVQDSEVLFENVTGLLSGSNGVFTEVLIDSEISVRQGFLLLDVYGEEVSVEFSIDVLKL